MIKMSAIGGLVTPERVAALADRGIIAFDPGGTTGVCFLGPNGEEDEKFLVDAYQEKFDAKGLVARFESVEDSDIIVFESYRLYPWKLRDQSWSDIQPVQLIGQIKLLAELRGIRVVEQTPGQAKGFVSDDKLKEWGLWIKGQPHANDAMRHAIYFLLFGDLK